MDGIVRAFSGIHRALRRSCIVSRRAPFCNVFPCGSTGPSCGLRICPAGVLTSNLCVRANWTERELVLEARVHFLATIQAWTQSPIPLPRHDSVASPPKPGIRAASSGKHHTWERNRPADIIIKEWSPPIPTESANVGDQRGRANDLQADEKTDHPSSRAFHGSSLFNCARRKCW